MRIGNLRVYQSNSLERITDPGTNQISYNIVAGWRGALLFATQLEEVRQHTTHTEWSRFTQGHLVYGWGTIRPEALAHAYVTLSFI